MIRVEARTHLQGRLLRADRPNVLGPWLMSLGSCRQVVQPFMCFASIPVDRGLSCALQGGT